MIIRVLPLPPLPLLCHMGISYKIFMNVCVCVVGVRGVKGEGRRGGGVGGWGAWNPSYRQFKSTCPRISSGC